MKTITFAYDIGDTVTIVATRDIDGLVAGMTVQTNGNTYRVIWWQDGRRMDEWLFEWELKGR